MVVVSLILNVHSDRLRSHRPLPPLPLEGEVTGRVSCTTGWPLGSGAPFRPNSNATRRTARGAGCPRSADSSREVHRTRSVLTMPGSVTWMTAVPPRTSPSRQCRLNSSSTQPPRTDASCARSSVPGMRAPSTKPAIIGPIRGGSFLGARLAITHFSRPPGSMGTLRYQAEDKLTGITT